MIQLNLSPSPGLRHNANLKFLRGPCYDPIDTATFSTMLLIYHSLSLFLSQYDLTAVLRTSAHARYLKAFREPKTKVRRSVFVNCDIASLNPLGGDFQKQKKKK